MKEIKKDGIGNPYKEFTYKGVVFEVYMVDKAYPTPRIDVCSYKPNGTGWPSAFGYFFKSETHGECWVIQIGSNRVGEGYMSFRDAVRRTIEINGETIPITPKIKPHFSFARYKY
jgi:hypothetical protein